MRTDARDAPRRPEGQGSGTPCPQARESAAPLSIHAVHEPEGLRDTLPGVQARFVPACPGRWSVTLTTLVLGDMVFQHGSSSPTLGVAVVRPSMVAILLPMLNAESLVMNAQPYEPHSFGAFGEHAEYVRANQRPSSHAVMLLPASLAEVVLETASCRRLVRRGSSAAVQTDAAVHRQAMATALGILRAAWETTDAFAAEATRRAARDALLQAARVLVLGAGGGEAPRAARMTARRCHLIRTADDYLRAHVDRPVYTEDLCAALGTSPSALAEAFGAALGLSPHRYLKRRRLCMVRAALDPEGPAPMVKAIALSHGFWHLGQFARDYHAQFGEMPSETLARRRRPASGWAPKLTLAA